MTVNSSSPQRRVKRLVCVDGRGTLVSTTQMKLRLRLTIDALEIRDMIYDGMLGISRYSTTVHTPERPSHDKGGRWISSGGCWNSSSVGKWRVSMKAQSITIANWEYLKNGRQPSCCATTNRKEGEEG